MHTTVSLYHIVSERSGGKITKRLAGRLSFCRSWSWGPNNVVLQLVSGCHDLLHDACMHYGVRLRVVSKSTKVSEMGTFWPFFYLGERGGLNVRIKTFHLTYSFLPSYTHTHTLTHTFSLSLLCKWGNRSPYYALPPLPSPKSVGMYGTEYSRIGISLFSNVSMLYVHGYFTRPFLLSACRLP